MEKRYLGDSVYAEFVDDWFIKLTTNNGYPDDPQNVILLERDVYLSLVDYAISVGFRTKSK